MMQVVGCQGIKAGGKTLNECAAFLMTHEKENISQEFPGILRKNARGSQKFVSSYQTCFYLCWNRISNFCCISIEADPV
jgi:hypothetical protein